MARIYCLIFCTAVCFVSLVSGSLARQLDWWETTLMYQLYPRSFKDTNGDGVGDLNGIYEKLDYLKDIGVESVWIQPFYKTANVDLGYDVVDFRKVDPEFGTMEDLKKLVKGSHDRGIKLLLDFIPNHTSKKHEWFKLSEDRVEPFTDYYVWRDPKRINHTHTTYPNNWRGLFGDSAWTLSEKRGQYYYHAFAAEQPDLNLRNPKVLQETDDVMRFWLDLGLDGFRVDAIPNLVEAEHLMDEPFFNNPEGNGSWSDYLLYSLNQPENFEYLHHWRLVLDEYKKKDGQTRILCPELVEKTGSQLVAYGGNATYPIAHNLFFFKFLFLSHESNATVFDDGIHELLDVLPSDRLPSWVVNSHDQHRLAAKFGSESADSLNMISLLLPGAALVYYGAELGLEDSLVRENQRVDQGNECFGRGGGRDAFRAPMPWNKERNAGFTTKDKPWLPLNQGYWRTNVETELQEPKSHLNVFKRLTQLRKTPVIRHGDVRTFVLSEWLFMFTRSLKNETIAVIVNLGSESEFICAHDTTSDLPDTMFVYTSSINTDFNTGDKVSLSNSSGRTCTELRPRAGIVLSTNAGPSWWRPSCLLIIITSALHPILRRGVN